MKKYIYTIVAATAMLASCSQDAELNEIIDNQPKAITEIGVSTSAETRAVISSEDNTKVYWESGDKLGVLGQDSNDIDLNERYTLNGEGGSTSGTFTNNTSEITTIYAIMYPYQESASYELSMGRNFICEIPTVQTAVKGSFDKAAAIMYQIDKTSQGLESTNVTLDYAVAFLKVTIGAEETNVHAISVYSSTALSGKVEITDSGVAAASEGSQTYVTLQADASNGALAAGDYYIAVLPGTLESLSIAYKYTDHTAKAKQGGSSLTLEAGHVKVISANFTTGTVHEAKQLWADGPFFATENAGEMSWTNGMNAWGSAWTIASESDLTNLYTDSNATRSWAQENSEWGFKFTGTAEGYAGNSIFLPSDGGSESYGDADYWSSTEVGSDWARSVSLFCSSGYFYGQWLSDPRTNIYFVRLVLR